MTFDHYTYILADHWASAIINADYTGLDDAEEKQLTEWLAENHKPQGHWDIEGTDESYFARDEISGLHANCITVRQYFPLEVAP
jgi:hypothetical protein